MFPASKQAVAVLEETKWVRTTESRISTVIAMLPTSLQSRIIPCRRSNSLQELHVQNIGEDRLPRPRPRPRPLSEADALVITNKRMVAEVIEDDLQSTTSSAKSPVPPLPPRSPRKGNASPARTASGIHWRFARLGIDLVQQFVGHGQASFDDENSAFERKAYIDGLTYLLRGLPSDLEPCEIEQIRSALPAGTTMPTSSVTVDEMPARRRSINQQRSVLHRAVQATVIYVIFFFHFVLPYLLLCFKFLVRLERKHKVSERVVGHGMNLANAAGRRGASFTETLCGMNDGKVGRALSELAAWTVDGVMRGISDGVGEGLVIAGTIYHFVMFRQGARRCARQASIIATPSALVRSRAVLPAIRTAAASATHSPSLFRTFSLSTKHYSSAAAAQEAEAPSAPAGEITRFEDLSSLGVHRNLIKAITEDMGYETMTPVQAKTIVSALKGTDIVAQAKTGTGKTLAFLLPLFQRMLEQDPSLASRKSAYSARSDDIRGIVLSPTRELAEQIAAEAHALAKHTGLVVQVAVGGTDKRSMLRQVQRQGCHLLVATPGRLNDLLEDDRSGIDAPKLAAMVLDEADRILDVGFEPQLRAIIGHLPDAAATKRQTMLVSATIPEDVIRLARSMVRADDFQFVQTIAENESLTHDRVPQHLVPLDTWANTFPTLFELLDREAASTPNFKAIVYFNTTALTELATALAIERRKRTRSKHFIWGISSKMTQSGRQQAADRFRAAESGVLISSDVTARGMDFPNVTHVIQIDGPRERESYIHRVGRTARQGKDGQSWLLLPPSSSGFTRKLLRGLPLQPNNSLSEVASFRADGNETPPPAFEEVKGLVESVSPDALAKAYMSLFGNTKDKYALAEELKTMFVSGLGHENTPAVPSLWVSKMGLPKNLVNVVDTRRGRFGGENIEASSRDTNDRRAPQSGDVWDQMRSNVRHDRPQNDRRQFDRRRGDDRRGGRQGRDSNYGGDRSRSSQW
ncbi:ATP-dependent RNA helicase cyt-19 [Paramyrothecium foliicola]|nr:ATP-dependent RNA helicase cyt-19 [Paramyrothecium foliicola]